MNAPSCPVCEKPTASAGRKFGNFSAKWYDLFHCPACRFSFIGNPWTDFEIIYSEAYYEGNGVDPCVDYQFELDHPDKTVRSYEWEGLLEVVSQLTPITKQTNWLDFGCGNGGLVRYVNQATKCQIVGFDEGSIVSKAMELGIPTTSCDELEASVGCFDVITAVEVLEHTITPLETLRLIRRLLKPGGVLFLTTGNSKPFRGRLQKWNYVIPEIHVSFFEPETLAILMKNVGLNPEFRGFIPG